MLEYWYPQHVIQKLSISEEEFWESKGLVINDWSALAVVFFTDIFSLDFLTPLDDTDTKFKLEVINVMINFFHILNGIFCVD